MVERKMRCIEEITTEEAIQSLETCGDVIFEVTNSHKMKVIDTSRKVKDVTKNMNVKCIRASQGKVYIGCMDSRNLTAEVLELAGSTNLPKSKNCLAFFCDIKCEEPCYSKKKVSCLKVNDKSNFKSHIHKCYCYVS